MNCRNCKKDKEITEFYFNPSQGKHNIYCKECCAIIAKRWRLTHDASYKKTKYALLKQPQHRAAHNGRVALRQIIKNIRPQCKFLVDCGAGSRDKLMASLIKTIPVGYKIEDYGHTLCVDHIKPCIKFDLTDYEQYCKCFNYKNLRLVTKSFNLSKGSKYRGPGRPRKVK
jgi:hypothetical protein